MKKLLLLTTVVAMAAPLMACNSPGERAAGGAVIGGLGGAGIGALASGGRAGGTLAGAAIGAAIWRRGWRGDRSAAALRALGLGLLRQSRLRRFL